MKKHPIILKYFPFLLIVVLVIFSACGPPSSTIPSPATTPGGSQALPTGTSALNASAMATVPISDVVPEDSMFAYFLSNGNLTIFATALLVTDLYAELAGKGPYTLFVPTNEAFAKLPPITFNALFDDTAKLKELVLYHIVQGEYPASELVPPMTLETLQGESLEVKLDEAQTTILINDAKFVLAEVPGKFGVGHVIDKVLFPPSELISPTGSIALPSRGSSPSGSAQ